MIWNPTTFDGLDMVQNDGQESCSFNGFCRGFCSTWFVDLRLVQDWIDIHSWPSLIVAVHPSHQKSQFHVGPENGDECHVC